MPLLADVEEGLGKEVRDEEHGSPQVDQQQSKVGTSAGLVELMRERRMLELLGGMPHPQRAVGLVGFGLDARMHQSVLAHNGGEVLPSHRQGQAASPAEPVRLAYAPGGVATQPVAQTHGLQLLVALAVHEAVCGLLPDEVEAALKQV